MTFEQVFGMTWQQYLRKQLTCEHHNREVAPLPADDITGALGEWQCSDCGKPLELYGGPNDGTSFVIGAP